MNKQPIDDLFEQARASMKANMPLENVEKLLQSSAGAPSKWTWKKIISSMSIIGIIITLSIGNILLTPSKNSSVNTKTLPLYPAVITQEALLLESNFIAIHELEENNTPITKDSTPPNPPAPVFPPVVAPLPPLAPAAPPAPPVISRPPSFLDSLGPKKTFTEYTLEIKKDNSEKELKALQKELGRYGIDLKIQQLTYHPDQTIKRFKGKFETDSLFCSTQLQEHEFDIQGAFKTMQFTFRVADEKNLKYLKIQSDDFEETIECYDDKVLSNSAQAKKIAQEAELAMRVAEQKMHHAHREAELSRQKLKLAQQEAAQSIAHILSLNADSVRTISREEFLAGFPNKKELFEKGFFPDSIGDVNVYYGNAKAQVEFFKQLAKRDWPNMDSLFSKSALPQLSDEVHLELEKARLEVERELQELLQQREQMELELERKIANEKRLKEMEAAVELDSKNLEKVATELEEEAKRLKKEAKRLKKEAKKKAKKEAQEPR